MQINHGGVPGMAPLHIEILLHYYMSCGDYRDGDFSASAVREYLDQHLEAGLLEPASEGEKLAPPMLELGTGNRIQKVTYYITPRGRALIDAMCALPLPVQVWVMPT